ncbi:hypothetical protein ABKN59_000447 [Abortiporus biennis]
MAKKTKGKQKAETTPAVPPKPPSPQPIQSKPEPPPSTIITSSDIPLPIPPPKSKSAQQQVQFSFPEPESKQVAWNSPMAQVQVIDEESEQQGWGEGGDDWDGADQATATGDNDGWDGEEDSGDEQWERQEHEHNRESGEVPGAWSTATTGFPTQGAWGDAPGSERQSVREQTTSPPPHSTPGSPDQWTNWGKPPSIVQTASAAAATTTKKPDPPKGYSPAPTPKNIPKAVPMSRASTQAGVQPGDKWQMPGWGDTAGGSASYLGAQPAVASWNQSMPYTQPQRPNVPPSGTAPRNFSSAAWTQWGKEKGMMPRVATTIAASVPAPSSAPPQPQAAPVYPADRGRDGFSHQDQRNLLASLLTHPAQNQGPPMPVPQVHRHPTHQQHPGHHGAQINLMQQDQLGNLAGFSAWGKAGHLPQPKRPQSIQKEDSWGSQWGPGSEDAGYGWGTGEAFGIKEGGTWGDTGKGGGDTSEGKGGAAWGDKGGHDFGGKGGGDPWTKGAGGGWGGKSNVDDGWGQPAESGWGGGHAGNDGWGTIPEEEEGSYDDGWDDEEDEEEEDENDDQYNHRVRFSEGHGHNQRRHSSQPVSPQHHKGKLARSHSGRSYDSYSRHGRSRSSPAYPSPLLPNPQSSKTMNFASGRMTSIFETTQQPRNVTGENVFVDSHGEALQYAERALYSKDRAAKDRIHWMFDPKKDERVSSLLDWIQVMSNGLASLGLQRFIETGRRGALISNADYRTNEPGTPAKPAFDWITIDELQPTLDRTLQESVICYNPSTQVVVFVFLLSKTGNSMAMWRRKLTVPESVRSARRRQITEALNIQLQEKYKVHVDSLLPKPEPAPPPAKKKRPWWKRLFGIS